MTLAGQGRWIFHPFDGSPRQGRIAELHDRHGNKLTFDYDAAGRLTTIHDTLDTETHNRDVTIVYNSAGFIESVTDWTGRQVRYEYYQDGDEGGSFGDLKSVTTPAVVPSTEYPFPPGVEHEYLEGKTTVYTYTKGFADDRLNHNLVTITDPKGQTYLHNFYAHTIDAGDPRYTVDPGNLYYDRIVRQVWGNPDEIFDLVYETLTPGQGPAEATKRTIVNDRVGNVRAYFYDALNRGVLMREFTGRWPADQPTFAPEAGPPVPKLRPDDPNWYDTQYFWNDDSLPMRIVHPNGNEETFAYDSGNADPRMRGNLLEKCMVAGPPGGDQEQICEQFEYFAGFGGCCGTNFVTRHVDGRGNETLHDYDAVGNRTRTTHRIPSIVEDFEYNVFGQRTAHLLPDNGSMHRRRDESVYYVAGPAMGYLHQEIVDGGGLNLTTTYEYDLVGNVRRMIDPRGHDTIYQVNQLNQTVREVSREVTEGGGVRYQRDTFYDPNDNVVRVDIENRDDQGALQPNSHFTTLQEYDILNHLTRMCQEHGEYLGAIPGSAHVPTCEGLPVETFVTTEYE